MQEVESANLAIYAIWEPILRPDDERSARKASTLFPDERVHNYWVETQDVGQAFQSAIGLVTEPAWDVYLVYPPGVTWEDKAPPKPTYFMHQLGGRLPDDRQLDGPGLRAQLQRMLTQ